MRTLRHAPVVLLCLALFSGCGDDSAPPGTDAGSRTDAGGSPIDAGPLDAGPPAPDAGGTARTLRASIGPIAVAAREEDTQCVVLALDNDVPMLVTEVRATLTGTSHHMIVYRAVSGTPSATPFPCSPFRDLIRGDAPLAMVQEHSYRTPFPSGVGLRIEAHQLIRIEMHYVNPGAAPDSVMGAVELDAVAAAGSAFQSADFFFWGTAAISVPARSTGSARLFARPPAAPATPMHFFMLSSHMHARGVRATIDRTTAIDGPAGPVLHESIDWAEPMPDWLDPAQTFDGSDGMRMVCEYDNAGDTPVSFGEGVSSEMCFLLGLYYPSDALGFVIRIDGL